MAGHVVNRFATGGDHIRAGDAGEPNIGASFVCCSNESGPMNVGAGFGGADENERVAAVANEVFVRARSM